MVHALVQGDGSVAAGGNLFAFTQVGELDGLVPEEFRAVSLVAEFHGDCQRELVLHECPRRLTQARQDGSGALMCSLLREAIASGPGAGERQMKEIERLLRLLLLLNRQRQVAEDVGFEGRLWTILQQREGLLKQGDGMGVFAGAAADDARVVQGGRLANGISGLANSTSSASASFLGQTSSGASARDGAANGGSAAATPQTSIRLVPSGSMLVAPGQRLRSVPSWSAATLPSAQTSSRSERRCPACRAASPVGSIDVRSLSTERRRASSLRSKPWSGCVAGMDVAATAPRPGPGTNSLPG